MQVRPSVQLMPQIQPSGRGLLPSPTAWSPDQHLVAMLADVSRYILGRIEGCGISLNAHNHSPPSTPKNHSPVHQALLFIQTVDQNVGPFQFVLKFHDFHAKHLQHSKYTETQETRYREAHITWSDLTWTSLGGSYLGTFPSENQAAVCWIPSTYLQ